MAAVLFLLFIPAQIKAATEPVSTSIPASKSNSAEAAKENILLNRLNEINLMNKSKLNSSEKKQLRIEVRSIKKQLSELGGGIYISAAAIIIIVLLLVFLL